MNQDGLKDLIAGKRYYAHNGSDPGGNDTVVLYWYELVRPSGQTPYYIPHLINTGVGAGTQFVVDDLDGDSLPDIVVSNKKGVHIMIRQ